MKMDEATKARKLGSLWHGCILDEIHKITDTKWSYIKDGRRYWFKEFEKECISDEILSVFVILDFVSQAQGKLLEEGKDSKVLLDRGYKLLDGIPSVCDSYTLEESFKISDLIEEHISSLIHEILVENEFDIHMYGMSIDYLKDGTFSPVFEDYLKKRYKTE